MGKIKQEDINTGERRELLRVGEKMEFWGFSL